MARTDNDTWDLASSVGATATMVAAARAVATRMPTTPLINDPFAEPLVRAVGVDFFTRLATGELDPAGSRRAASRRWACAGSPTAWPCAPGSSTTSSSTPAAAGIRQAVILASGLDSRAYRLPWPAGTVVFEIDQPEVIEFKTGDAGRTRRRARPPTAARSRSTCATTGRPRCRRRASTRRSPRRGAPRACSATCRPRPRTGCSTRSPS